MNVIRLAGHTRKRTNPIVALIDLQNEFLSEGRAHYLKSAVSTIENCSMLLETARQLKLPIAHFRLLQTGYFFNRASPFSNWVDQVRPRANEYVFDRALPSCFSNPAFDELMREVEYPEVIIAGLGGERGCLSTAVDCFHRGYSATFVTDCSASLPVRNGSESGAHASVVDLISVYADVIPLKHFLDRLTPPLVNHHN